MIAVQIITHPWDSRNERFGLPVAWSMMTHTAGVDITKIAPSTASALQVLRRDPALRSGEHDRLLLRMLSAVDTLDEYGAAAAGNGRAADTWP
jgi:hypothetical protein